MVPVSVVVISSVTVRVHDFWVFYRRYTDTTVHTASTAALAIFGILVFVDPWFAAVAIFCYVVPPVALYVLADERVSEPERPPPSKPERSDRRRHPETHATDTPGRAVESVAARSGTARSSVDDGGSRSNPNADAGIEGTGSDTDDAGETITDSDRTDVDTDSDSKRPNTDPGSDAGGTDSGSDDGDSDSDSDSDETDSDSDSDNGDSDSDSDNGDSDSDSDNGDSDSDSDDGDSDSDTDS